MLQALRAAGVVIGSAHRFVPGVAAGMKRRGSARLRAAEEMARTHGFGVKLEIDEDEAEREAIFEVLCAGVRQRFESRAVCPG